LPADLGRSTPSCVSPPPDDADASASIELGATRLKRSDPGEQVDPESHDVEADPLWSRLRDLRSEWAREARQPAYCVFTNQTLEAIVRDRPRTPHQLAAVKGLGPARIERFGAVILQAVAGSGSPPADTVPVPRSPKTAGIAAKANDFGPASSSQSSAAQPSRYVPTEEWTWRLLDRGFTLDEAAAVRSLERSAIIRHVTWMARQGRAIPLASFLPREIAERWDAWHVAHGDAPPPPEADAAADLWPLFLACRRAQAAGES
jgi:hypothetical protein